MRRQHNQTSRAQSTALHAARSSTVQPTRDATAQTNANAAPDLVVLANAAALWAQSSTNSDLDRAIDVRRDKLRVVLEFFAFLDKDLNFVTPLDVQAWQLSLEKRLKSRTIYFYSAHLSLFFEWLRRQPEFAPFFPYNPVRAAFPRCPNPYESAGTRSLTDENFVALWETIERAAEEPDAIVARRDYAIFRFFVATGSRRSEILNLRGADVELSVKTGGLVYYPRIKGGIRVGKSVADKEVRRALVEYLEASARFHVLGTDQPLWLAHDRGARRRFIEETLHPVPNRQVANHTRLIERRTAAAAPLPLSSHAFARRMKLYAAQAGLSNFHLHQLRHTFARLVSEETGSLSATQEALSHKNMKTTGAYVARIEIKTDRHSEKILERIRQL